MPSPPIDAVSARAAVERCRCPRRRAAMSLPSPPFERVGSRAAFQRIIVEAAEQAVVEGRADQAFDAGEGIAPPHRRRCRCCRRAPRRCPSAEPQNRRPYRSPRRLPARIGTRAAVEAVVAGAARAGVSVPRAGQGVLAGAAFDAFRRPPRPRARPRPKSRRGARSRSRLSPWASPPRARADREIDRDPQCSRSAVVGRVEARAAIEHVGAAAPGQSTIVAAAAAQGLVGRRAHRARSALPLPITSSIPASVSPVASPPNPVGTIGIDAHARTGEAVVRAVAARRRRRWRSAPLPPSITSSPRAAEQRIVARRADQRVVASAAAQPIGASAAGEPIREGRAGQSPSMPGKPIACGIAACARARRRDRHWTPAAEVPRSPPYRNRTRHRAHPRPRRQSGRRRPHRPAACRRPHHPKAVSSPAPPSSVPAAPTPVIVSL